MPAVSVVLPAYNAEPYIADALISIREQSFQDFECIVINDGSTDKTQATIEKTVGDDRRFRLICRENRGLVYSLNQGIKESSGEFVARMDADDVSSPFRMACQLNYLKERQLDVCGCHYFTINESDKVIGAQLVVSEHYLCELQLTKTVPFAHGSVMLRKEFLEKNGLGYDAKYCNKAEDFLLWVRMLEAGAKFGNVDDFLFKYRVLSDSLCRSKSNLHDAKRVAAIYRARNSERIISALDRAYSERGGLSRVEQECVANAALNNIGRSMLHSYSILSALPRRTVAVAAIKKLYFRR